MTEDPKRKGTIRRAREAIERQARASGENEAQGDDVAKEKQEDGPALPDDEQTRQWKSEPKGASSTSTSTGTPALSAEEVESLKAAAKERDELKNKYLRALADFDNYQKRARREQERFREEASRDILKELLLVIDNLDLALASAKPAEGATPGQALETVEKGLKLVRDQLLRVLAQRGAEPLATKPGEKFDPDRHEAVMSVPVPGLAQDEVGMVARDGYKLGPTILRPAAVQVRKAAPGASPPPTSPEEKGA